MKKIYLLLFVLFSFAFHGFSQAILQESFEGTFPPNGWTIINNGTGNTWTQNTNSSYSYDGTNSMAYLYNISNAADAWAFTPSLALNLHPVTVTFFVSVRSASFPERLKFTVGKGNTVAAQTITLLDSSNLINQNYRKWTATFTPSTAGNYNFAFNCHSLANMWNVYIDSVTIYQLQPPCAGSPIGGTTYSSLNSVCSSQVFNLGVNGATGGASNLSYQWQTSSDSLTWNDIIGETNSTYTETNGITSDTYYRRKISCSGGTAVASKPVHIYLKPVNLCYCSPVNGNTLHTFTLPSIDSVAIIGTTLHVAHKGEPSNGYTQDSSVVNLKQGLSYKLFVKYSYTVTSGVWIDWDQSGTFDANEFQLLNTPSDSTGTAFIYIPSTALLGKTGMRIRSLYSYYTLPSSNACTSYSSGETEDYTVNILQGTQCNGKPAAGKAVTTLNPICPNVSFAVNVVNDSRGVIGLSYQWQSSSDSINFSDISSANDTSYVETGGISVPTYYRRITLCSSGLIDTSKYLKVDTNATNLCYCSPATGTPLHYYASSLPTIDSVAFTGTNLHVAHKGEPAYGYSLDTTAARLKQGLTYTLALKFSSNTTIGSVWIDWDQNGTFDATEWQRITTTATSAYAYINVPVTALLGKTGMRIRASTSTFGNSAADACTLLYNGETEDYYINVLQGTLCSGKPFGGNTTSSQKSICPNIAFTLNTTKDTKGVVGLAYQWQISSDSLIWTDIAGANDTSYIESGGITATSYYRRIIICSTGSSDTSKPIGVKLNPFTICFCGPNTNNTLHTSLLPSIDSVAITGSALHIAHKGEVSTGLYIGYTLDTTHVASIKQGYTYTLYTRFSNTALSSVWIDWDQSGTFDPNEWQQITTNATSGSITFTVPFTAITGKTGMRIRTSNTFYTNNSGSACTSFYSGETEDYVVNILAGTPCTGKPIGGKTISSSYAVCPSISFTLNVTNSTSRFSGLSYQWQTSSDSINWSDITSANDTSYLESGGITSSTYYRRIITCSSGFSDTSKFTLINVNPTNLCYCGPNVGTVINSGTLPSIDSVAIIGTNLHVAHKGEPSNGYTQDTTIVNLKQGYTYTIYSKYSTTASGSMWIDWDQSGTFDATEWVSLTTSGTTSTITFTVPVNATLGVTGLRIRSVPTYYTLTGTYACYNFYAGETEDYLVNVLQGTPCTGKPIGGKTVASAKSICANVDFTVGVTNSTQNVVNLSYQWQTSTDSITWSDINAANDTSYVETGGISTPTYYRRIITCSSGFSDTSKSVLVGINPYYLCICSPITGTTLHQTTGPTIDSVALVGTTMHVAHKGSPVSGYTIDSTTINNLKQGVNYTLYTKFSAASSAGLWIDLDQSGTFDPSEYYLLTSNGTSSTVNITIPTTATLGKTVLRIRSQQYYYTMSSNSACILFSSGETEDYVINITAGTPCAGTPLGGQTISTSTNVCPNVSFTLDVNNGTSGLVGLSYQWQSSPDSINWNDEVGETNTNYVVTSGISAITYYRRKITCGTHSSYSKMVTIQVNPNYLCPCSPYNGTTLHSSTGPSIDSVSITGTILNNNSLGEPSNGYSIFTDTTKMPTLARTVSYNLFTQAAYNPTQASIWIDWNQNGTFEASEYQLINFGSGTTASTNFTVPTTAVLGKTIMRIRIRAANYTSADACGTFGSGETEDYLINVAKAPSCLQPSAIKFPIITSSSVKVTWTPPSSAPSGGYDVYYSTSNTIPTTPSLTGIINDSITINGLQSSTTYYVWVRSNCGGSSTSFWTLGIVSTSCGAITALPFNESFEGITTFGTGLVPYCWSTVAVSGTNFTSNNTSIRNNIGAKTGTNYVYSRWSSTAWLISPGVQLTAGQSYDVSYFYRPTDPINGFILNSYIGTSSDTTILLSKLLGSINNPIDTSNYNQSINTFVPTTSGVYYFAIKSICTSSAPWYMLFDDISISKTPSCVNPKNITFTSIKSTSVQLKWTPPTSAPSGGYEIYYSTSNTTPTTPSLTGILNDSVTINGLQSSTTYYIWVRSNCGTGSTSIWTKSNFTTSCAPITTLPMNEGFENLSTFGAGIVPNCWSTKVGSGTNFTSSSSSISSTNNTISAYNGSNFVYSRWSSNAWLISNGIQLTAGKTYTFSYYYEPSDPIAGFTINTYVAASSDTTVLSSNLLGSIVDPVDNTTYNQASYTFTPSTTGVYYFAVQSLCPSFAPWYLAFDDFSVTSNVTTSVQIQGYVHNPNGVTIPNVKVNLYGSVIDSSIINGNYSFTENVGGNFTVKASKNNDVKKSNGITTIDIALIQGHILQKNLFNSPYKIVASDVDNNGLVNTIDLVYIKRLILGLDTAFNGNRLWKFIDSSYVFPNPSKPFPVKDSISFNTISANQTNQSFIGVKLGDVNYDWNPAILKGSFYNKAIELYYDNITIDNNDLIKIPVRVKNFNKLIGMQFTLNFNKDVLKFAGIENNLLKADYGSNHSNEGLITFLWNDPNNEYKTLSDGSVIFELAFTKTGSFTQEDILLSADIASIEAWDASFNLHNIVKTDGKLISKKVIATPYVQNESWEVMPNPTEGLIQARIALAKSKTIYFELRNAEGFVLFKDNHVINAGINSLLLNLQKDNHLSSGIYFLKAIGLEGESVKRILIK